MKSFLTLLLSFVITNFALAQTSGVISYSETVKMNITIDGGGSGGIDLSEFLPESMTSNSDLFFDGKISSYKKAESENENLEMGDEDSGIKIIVMSDDIDSELYINYATKMITDQKGFMGKAFIVEESLEKMKWKITGEKVKYLEYECIKATRTKEDGKEVVAWFAPKITASVGPMMYGQLPGAILMLSEGEDDLVIKATKVELMEVSEIKKPTKGDKVTDEEYKKIVEEKTKEMMQGHSGSSFQIGH